jgi:hypothetical protein
MTGDVAQAQHPRAIRDHSHGVALVGVFKDLLRVRLDVAAGRSHPWRVPDGKVVKVADRGLGRGLDLALVKRVQSHRVLGRLFGFG